MIAFASLFLGLFIGVKPVEVVVGQDVATVELRLDGQSLGKLRGAPWIRECDFGAELAPRHLEAVAFDAAGRELGRVSQWLNLPQEPAVTSVVLEPGDGGSRVARVSWESQAGAEPKSVAASLDGAALPVSDPRRIVLPAVDEAQLHLLHVELTFENHVTSIVDLTFGGAYADEVSTEITALAIRATRKPRRPPTAATARDWFTNGDETLRVITIEKGTAEIVVVSGRAFPRFVGPGESYKPPKSLRLGDQRLRFLSTIPEETEGVATTFNLFPSSPAYDSGLGDLYQLLTGVSFKARDDPPRLNSAVAVAGLAAYRGRNRRAVVIVPNAKPDTDTSLTPAQARRYLERLAVPLFVWNPESGRAPHLEAWGEVHKVGSLKQLAAAFEELTELLDQQWVVWLDGRHLPQDIVLSPQAEGFELLR